MTLLLQQSGLVASNASRATSQPPHAMQLPSLVPRCSAFHGTKKERTLAVLLQMPWLARNSVAVRVQKVKVSGLVVSIGSQYIGR